MRVKVSERPPHEFMRVCVPGYAFSPPPLAAGVLVCVYALVLEVWPSGLCVGYTLPPHPLSSGVCAGVRLLSAPPPPPSPRVCALGYVWACAFGLESPPPLSLFEGVGVGVRVRVCGSP